MPHVKASDEAIRLLPNMPRRLKGLRESHGLSPNDVAVAIGALDRRSVSRWEREDKRREVPALHLLVKLSRYYGVTLGYLVGEEG